ncbi:uncharacterized protein TRUGW13939_01907 [Talaromyces rugulosus]|uniref:Coenzyme Q-binding protein COQ10 START domain-containing protein n=1 Tax=Talaromyces rugulosus TaxID=121627 RepID=A0A7H8QLT2_TALRU|nr:uncharacterized protein TRUGW13939_01907 [Talaromyces rugulosus]QKX54818.1 hypothetical protein TRUGW13939_01907 [Talaromyces rugulosus]
MAQSTPSIPLNQAVVTTHSSVVVTKASVTSVWNTLIDTSTWPEWNRLVPKVIINSQPDQLENSTETPPSSLSPVFQRGTKMSLLFNTNADNEMDGNAPPFEESSLVMLKSVITVFEPPNSEKGEKGRIAWAVDTQAEGSWPKWLVYAERVHEIYQDEDGNVKVEDWELQTGVMAYGVRWMMGAKLERLRQIWIENLKSFVEAGNQG